MKIKLKIAGHMKVYMLLWDYQDKGFKYYQILQTSIKQIVLGNYSDDATLLGTIGQIALGFIGFDLPADIRDLMYDITNFKLTPSHALQTLLDAIALFPVVGSLKYSDEVIDAAKKADNLADSIQQIDFKINVKGKNSVEEFIKTNVHTVFQKNVKSAFKDDAKVTILKQDTVVYRYHGGTSNSTSYWYTPYQYSNPIEDLALPPGNTYQHLDTFIIPKGTQILEGTVAPNFGHNGGGYQFFIPDPSKLLKK